MGQSYYKMKIIFTSEKKAQENFPKIRAFFDRLNALDNAWQEKRFRTFTETPRSLFNELKTDFQDVFDQLQLNDLTPDRGLNCLAFQIGAGTDFDFEIHKKTVTVGGQIWHCSNWGPHATLMLKEYGAYRVGLKEDSDDYVYLKKAD